MAAISNYSSRSQTVFVVITTTIVLATLFVFARLVGRLGVLRTRTADDWFIILAWFIALGLSISIVYGSTIGLGEHDIDLPVERLLSLRKCEYVFAVLYNPALMATNTSILIFYLRMTSNTSRSLRIGSYVTLGLVNLSGVILTILNVFQCEPLTEAFSTIRTTRACRSIITLYLCSAPINIFTDIVILVFPIPVLTGLRLPSRQKTILVSTFTLGIFVTVVDLVRIYYLQETVLNQNNLAEQLGIEVDLAWNSGTAFMWSAVKVNVGIICACIPTLKPLLKRVLPQIISRNSEINMSVKTSSTPSIPQNSTHTQNNSCAEITNVEVLSSIPADRVSCDEESPVENIDFLISSRETGQNSNAQLAISLNNYENTSCPDFIDINYPQPMLGIHGWESFKYCALVTTFFSIWGFSYGLLNFLNETISSVAKPSTFNTLSLRTAYFGAYLLGALTVGQYVLRSVSFKATLITGLIIYGTGTLMFWPSAVVTSYTGFILSNFVVGFGLAVVETAANPFISLCGPESFSEHRLLLAQGVQATAAILSQLLANKVLFDDHTTLIDLQWTYLAVTLLTVILSLIFYYIPLPEVTDTDLALNNEYEKKLTTASNSDYKYYCHHSIIRVFAYIYMELTTSNLILFVIAQFLYVSSQESLSIFFVPILSHFSKKNILATLTLDNYNLLAHTLFAFGRFFFALLCLIFAPRVLLLMAFLLSLLFSTLIATLSISTAIDHKNGSSNFGYNPASASSTISLLLFFVESPIFPLLFSLGLRRLGKRTKSGAAYLTAAASGGGAFPWVMLAVNNQNEIFFGKSSPWVLVGLFAVGCGVITPIARENEDFLSRPNQEQSRNETSDEFSNGILSVTLTRSFGPLPERFEHPPQKNNLSNKNTVVQYLRTFKSPIEQYHSKFKIPHLYTAMLPSRSSLPIPVQTKFSCQKIAHIYLPSCYRKLYHFSSMWRNPFHTLKFPRSSIVNQANTEDKNLPETVR